MAGWKFEIRRENLRIAEISVERPPESELCADEARNHDGVSNRGRRLGSSQRSICGLELRPTRRKNRPLTPR